MQFFLPECGSPPWDPAGGRWGGKMALASGRERTITVCPDSAESRQTEQWHRSISRGLQYIRSHEPAILAGVADQMFDGWLAGWRDEEIDTIRSKEEFTRGSHDRRN